MYIKRISILCVNLDPKFCCWTKKIDDDHMPAVFEVIDMIIWKPEIIAIIMIAHTFFETTLPNFMLRGSLALPDFPGLFEFRIENGFQDRR